MSPPSYMNSLLRSASSFILSSVNMKLMPRFRYASSLILRLTVSELKSVSSNTRSSGLKHMVVPRFLVLPTFSRGATGWPDIILWVLGSSTLSKRMK